MDLVDKILDYKEYKNFNEIDLKELSLKKYEEILNKRMYKLSDSHYQLKDTLLLISLMSAYSEQKIEQKEELENIYYELLLKWLTFFQTDTISSILVGKELVKFLSNMISLEKLNQYNQVTQTSILKKTLISVPNMVVFDVLIDNGLKITEVEGLNPYYFTLLHSASDNITIQFLHLKNIPLPDNYWSYLFNSIAEGKIKEERNYLLSLKDKEFIINNKTKQSVWNKIITSKKYKLIKYLSDDMYKPHMIEGETLADAMKQSNDVLFLAHTGHQIVKLVEEEKQLYPVWDTALLDVSSRQELIGSYYPMFANILKNLPDEQAQKIVNRHNEMHKQREKNSLYILIKEITNHMYSQKELINDKLDNDTYKKLDYLIKLHKTRRDFPNELKEKIKQYLTALPFFNEAAPKQSENTEKTYEKDSLFIFDDCFEDREFLEEIHFQGYVNQLNNDYKTILFEECTKIQDLVMPINEIEIEKNNETVAEAQIFGPEEEKILLFTDEAVAKFKRDSGTDRDIVSSYIKKLTIAKKMHQYKTLAKASVLLEQLDNLYATFPHFENVINHIKNLMVLQEKGDKSFYIPPLLLGGGPGVGKTFFCHTVSKLVQTNFELLNMESVTANFVLTGSSAQWGGAEPGKIFKALFNEENKTLNPIFLLDELEKAGGSSSYGVMNSLLPLLERYTAKKFKDECIPLEIDASYVVWFATANDLDKLSAPIKSRFDIFSVPNPTPTQRKSLIKGIYKTVRENNSWGSYFDETLPEESLDVLANLMAPGAARDLRKSITMACSKAIVQESKIILPSHIERFETGETMPWDIITG